jgi:predicted P-loop ATPase/GTPase
MKSSLHDVDPLTTEEIESMVRVLDILCQNINRLLNQGLMVVESFDDELITSSRRTIDRYRDGIRHEQKRIQRLQSILKRRRDMESKRKE